MSSYISSILIASGIAYCSLAHSPKSISLQRSLQKGLNALDGENSDKLPHLGQATKRFVIVVMSVSLKRNLLGVLLNFCAKL